jgi:hypothetical protein
VGLRLIRVVFRFACFVALGAGFVAGILRGIMDAYHHRYLESREAVAPVLAAEPAFAGVELSMRSSGGISLTGRVPTGSEPRWLESPD